MRVFVVLILSLGISTISYGQISRDSITQSLPAASEKFGVDSVQHTLRSSPDSLLSGFGKIDSIRHGFNRAADSIQTNYKRTVAAIDVQTNNLRKQIDSLQRLNLPTTKYTKRLDSLKEIRLSVESKLRSTTDSLKFQTIDNLKALDVPAQYKAPLERLTKTIDKFNLNGDIIEIPELEVPGYSLPTINGTSSVTSKVSEVIDPRNLAELPDIDSPVGDIGDLSHQANSYHDDLDQITQGEFQNVEAFPETIEAQASKIDGIDKLQKQSGLVEGHKAKLADLNNSEKAKEKAVAIAEEAATDHFAGKQEPLKTAMEKISKYKKKYPSVSSIKNLPKRMPNPMRNKSFIERLVPGLYLQYQQKGFYLVDVNPYVGYKLTGRFTTGFGWNHRYAYNKDNRTFNSRSRIFGPRAYVDFKLGKGFIVHVEGESMNSFVPSTLRGNPDTGHREWVWSFMTGIKKEYKIYKNLKGTALIQYNWFNRYYKAPYVDRLNSRIGFEYAFEVKQKRKDNARR